MTTAVARDVPRSNLTKPRPLRRLWGRSVDPSASMLRSAGVARTAASTLSQSGTTLDVAEGTVLCQFGDYGRETFVLVDGVAVVELADGDEVEVGPGQLLGERAVLDDAGRRNATVRMRTAGRVLVFEPQVVRALALTSALDTLTTAK